MRPLEVEPRGDCRLWLRYSDGAQGEVDLSDLAGRGVFKAWDEDGYFATAHIGAAGGIAWEGGIELCPDSLYMRLTGKSIEEVVPALRSMPVDA